MTTMTVKIQNVDELFDDMRQASEGEALGNIAAPYDELHIDVIIRPHEAA